MEIQDKKLPAAVVHIGCNPDWTSDIFPGLEGWGLSIPRGERLPYGKSAVLGFGLKHVTTAVPADNGCPGAAGGFITTKLAEMPGDTLMDTAELAALLRVSSRTIRRMVYCGELPKGIKMGGRRLWLAGNLRGYLKDEAERCASLAKISAQRFRAGGYD